MNANDKPLTFGQAEKLRTAHFITFERALKHSAKRRITYPQAVRELVDKVPGGKA